MPLCVFSGPCSFFGGPYDEGVAPDEGLAFFYEVDDAPHLFLPEQPPDTTGLARRLNPERPYVACRWDYDVVPKDFLADPGNIALVLAGGRYRIAWPADWGPHEDTGRAADLSPALMDELGLETDDNVTVIYPVPANLLEKPHASLSETEITGAARSDVRRCRRSEHFGDSEEGRP